MSKKQTGLPSRYHRRIKGAVVDLYDVAAAYGVTCNARFHAMKKIAMAGQRGVKGVVQDLEEAAASIARAIELAKQAESGNEQPRRRTDQGGDA